MQNDAKISVFVEKWSVFVSRIERINIINYYIHDEY